MPQVKQINHVAVVVENMEKALSFWRDALGMELHGLRDVPAEKSQVAFLPLPGSEVEFRRRANEVALILRSAGIAVKIEGPQDFQI